MKRIVLLLLVFIITASLTACISCPGDNPEPQASSVESSAEENSAEENSAEENSAEESQISETGNEEYLMTFSNTGSAYKVECEYLGKPLSLTFVKRSWGTWNLGSWVYDGVDFTSSSTDWEYVYRASYSETGVWSWSGGNHDNETMLDTRFYDAAYGADLAAELVVEPGDSVDITGLAIVEETKLHVGDAEDTYCDVTRVYYISGPEIRLEVDYSYTKDTWQYLSYTAMLPIQYGYGKYISYDDGKTFITTNSGKSDYSGPFHDGKSTKAVIYGDSNPNYFFTVKSLTPEASFDSFSNTRGCMYWEMNPSHQKLYFSKYSADSPTKVEAGTELKTIVTWVFENRE